MIKLLVLTIVTMLATTDEKSEVPPVTKQNAEALVRELQAGADLTQVGLHHLVSQEEISELKRLKGCAPSLQSEMTKNLIIYDWQCTSVSAGSTEQSYMYLTTAMRFRDDSSLFALAINPGKQSFAPTQVGLSSSSKLSQERIARDFGEAVEAGSDPRLGGLIPLTFLQAHQLGRLSGGDAEIIKEMTALEKRRARQLLRRDVSFYERPQDGIELTITGSQQNDEAKNVTLFFDKQDRPVGVHIERSLVTVSPISR